MQVEGVMKAMWTSKDGLSVRWVALACVLGIAAAACEPGGSGLAADGGPVVATWSGGEITQDAFDSWRRVHGQEPTVEAVREMAFVLSMAEATLDRGADEDRTTILELEATRQAVLVPALREVVVADEVVTDADLEEVRREHPEALNRPRKLKLRSIYKRLPVDDGPAGAAVRKRMQGLRTQLLEGAEFSELAAAESASQSRFRGGLVGLIDPEELPAPLRAAVVDLEVGQLSPVVEHAGGLYLFLCEQIRPPVAKKFEDVREIWRERLLNRRQVQRWRTFMDELLESAQVRIAPGEDDVLVLDEERVSADDFARILALRAPNRTAESLGEAEREKLLKELARGILGAREAERRGLHERPDVAEDLRWKSVDTLARRELVRRMDARLAEPTSEEKKALYDAWPHRFRHPEEVHLGIIYFGAVQQQSDPPGWLADVRAVVAAVEAGDMAFEDAAREYSRAPSASSGGDAGWRSLDELRDLGPRFTSALRALEPGQSTGLMRLESGLWYFDLRGRRPARQKTLEEADPVLHRLVREQQIEALQQTVREEQLASIDLQVNEQLLADEPEPE